MKKYSAFIKKTVKPAFIYPLFLSILSVFLSNNVFAESLQKQAKPIDDKPIDFGKDMLYVFNMIDKAEVDNLKIYDSALKQMNAVDSNYRYTDMEKVTQFFTELQSAYKTTPNKLLASQFLDASFLNSTTKQNKTTIDEFSPNKMAFTIQSQQVMDDVDLMFMKAFLRSPAYYKGYCQRLYTPKVFRANNVQVIYRFTDKNNQPIHTQVFDMDTCKGTTPIANWQPVAQTPDEKISELTKAFNAYHPARIANATDAQKNSFYYLMMMGNQLDNQTNDTQSIINKGKQFVDEINQVENDVRLTQKQQDKKIIQLYKSMMASRILLNSDRDLLCFIHNAHLSYKSCLQKVLSSLPKLKKVIDKPTYQKIHQRYQTYIAMPPAITQFNQPNIKYSLPSYQVLTIGQKLNQIHLFQLAKSGKYQQAHSESMQEFTKLRQHFAYSDTLINKMVLTAMMQRQLQTIILLKTRFDTKDDLNFSTNTLPIKRLTSKELSMHDALMWEYRMFSFMLHNQSVANQTNNPRMNRVFKVNESANINAKIHKKLLTDLKVTSVELVRRMLESNKHKENEIFFNSMFSESNQFGKYMIMTGLVDMDGYSVRFHQLNNDINAVNHILTEGKVPLTNVFAPTLAKVDKTNNRICYDLPKIIDTKAKVIKSCLFL